MQADADTVNKKQEITHGCLDWGLISEAPEHPRCGRDLQGNKLILSSSYVPIKTILILDLKRTPFTASSSLTCVNFSDDVAV